MSRRRARRRGGRSRSTAAKTFYRAMAAAVVTFIVLAVVVRVAENAAMAIGTFAMGVVVGHGLPTVRVIWRRR